MLTCPACGFENMRGSLVCARCRGRLVWDGSGDKDDFQPPRAGRGKTRRRLLFFLRAKTHARHARATSARSFRPDFTKLIEAAAVFSRGWRRLPFANKLAAALSLVPGLGHAVLGQFGQAAARFLGWLAILGSMVAIYSNDPSLFVYLAGPMWIGALAVHILTAVSAAVPDYRRADRELQSVAIMIAVIGSLIYLVAAYWLQPHLVGIVYEYRGGPAP